jgi:hypothetical protein
MACKSPSSKNSSFCSKNSNLLIMEALKTYVFSMLVLSKGDYDIEWMPLGLAKSAYITKSDCIQHVHRQKGGTEH